MDLFGLIENKLTSDKCAVQYFDGEKKISFSYKILREIVRQISSVFEKLDIKDTVVGLALEDNAYVVPAILSCIKSYGAFFTLNSGGKEYISKIITRIGIGLIVTDYENLKGIGSILQNFESVKLHEILLAKSTLIVIKLTKIFRKKYNEKLAYCITTSGTTAEPKIVYVPHSCIVSNIHSLQKYFNLHEEKVFLFSPFTFDPSIVDLFLALMSESCLLMVSKQLKLSHENIDRLIFQKQRITYLQATPSYLMGLKNVHKTVLGDDSDLKILALGGEPFPPISTINLWKSKRNTTRIFNLYGITELSCWSSCYELTINDLSACSRCAVPIGKSLDDTDLFVENMKRERITEGEGELVLSGMNGRFCYMMIDGKLRPQHDHYTGDWVQISKGEIIFKQRLDEQVKRNGQRVNLQQIKKVALEHPGVINAEVFLEKCLIYVAFLMDQLPLAKQSKNELEQSVQKHVRNNVPSYCRPDYVVHVEHFPLTSHGKFHKQEIIQGMHRQSHFFDIKEKGCLENAIMIIKDVWNQILQPNSSHPRSCEGIFTSEGGNSLQALCFVSKIESKMNIKCPELLDIVFTQTYKNVEKYIICALGLWEAEISSDSANPKDMSINTGKSFGSLGTCIDEISVKKESDLRYSIHRCSRTFGKVPTLDIVKGGCTKKRLLEKWKYNSGKCIDASPLVVGLGSRSLVFIGSHSHKLAALDTKSGFALWEIFLGDRVISCAAISICGKFIVVGCCDGYVYVLCAADGSEWWKYKTDSTVKSSPLIHPTKSLVFIGSYDQHLHAINIYDKEPVFKLYLGGGSIFSSPCLCSKKDILYCCTLSGNISAVDLKSGTLAWNLGLEKPVFSSPVASYDQVYVGDVGGNMFCFSSTGEQIWKFQCDGPIFSSPCLWTNKKQETVLIFGCHDCHIYCLDKDANLIWKVKLESPVYSSPFVFTGKFETNISENRKNCCDKRTTFEGNYSLQENFYEADFCCVACTTGLIMIMDMDKGSLICDFKCPGEIFSSPVVCFPYVFVGCRDDFMYCFEIK